MKKQLTKDEAALMLVYEATRERLTKAGYYRSVRAVNALDLTVDGASTVLNRLEYTDTKGMPHKWLTAKRGDD